jgi:hypothetical protein
MPPWCFSCCVSSSSRVAASEVGSNIGSSVLAVCAAQGVAVLQMPQLPTGSQQLAHHGVQCPSDVWTGNWADRAANAHMPSHDINRCSTACGQAPRFASCCCQTQCPWRAYGQAVAGTRRCALLSCATQLKPGPCASGRQRSHASRPPRCWYQATIRTGRILLASRARHRRQDTGSCPSPLWARWDIGFGAQGMCRISTHHPGERNCEYHEKNRKGPNWMRCQAALSLVSQRPCTSTCRWMVRRPGSTGRGRERDKSWWPQG